RGASSSVAGRSPGPPPRCTHRDTCLIPQASFSLRRLLPVVAVGIGETCPKRQSFFTQFSSAKCCPAGARAINCSLRRTFSFGWSADSRPSDRWVGLLARPWWSRTEGAQPTDRVCSESSPQQRRCVFRTSDNTEEHHESFTTFRVHADRAAC